MNRIFEEVFRAHAAVRSEALAVHRIDVSGGEGESLTRQELLEQATRGARHLAARIRPGDRVVLAHAPGLEFVVSVLAVWLAGGVVVPAGPPVTDRTRVWLEGIIRASGATLLLGDPVLLPRLKQVALFLDVEATCLQSGPEAELPAFDSGPETLALVQFTSGSTSAPRGVCVTRGQLAANLDQIARASAFDEREVAISWLPHYHNMGLIGMILLPLWVGFPTHLMSPMEFLEQPGRWLSAISRYRGTYSGGPNFAFDLAAIRTTPAEFEALDLSNWIGAFCGSEPVRVRSLERFAARFGPKGFDSCAYFPSYGMAEATLIVTGPGRLKGMNPVSLDAAALADGQVVEVPVGTEGARTLVPLGRTWGDLELAVVDPASGERVESGRVGEVWLKGSSVASGYWGEVSSPDANGPFGHVLEGRPDWLRTGDLGFLHGGELVLTGRIKELIILNGRNLHPADLEAAIAGCHPGLIASVAFALEGERSERLVIVAEVAPQVPAAALTGVEQAIRLALRNEDVTPHEVVLVAPEGILRTATGKLARFATRAAHLEGRLKPLTATAPSGGA